MFTKIFGKNDTQFKFIQHQRPSAPHGVYGSDSVSMELDINLSEDYDESSMDVSRAGGSAMEMASTPTHICFESVELYVACKLKEIDKKFGGDLEEEGCYLCDEVRRSSQSW